MRARESGTTLLIVLIMLVVITLLGIASIRISGSSLMVVGNMQARKFAENWTLQAIEQRMNSITPFNTPGTQILSTTTASGTNAFLIYGVPNGVHLTVAARTSLFSSPASGHGAVPPLAP